MKYQHQATHGAGTETAEGYVAHKEVFCDQGLILAPVKVQVENRRAVMQHCYGGYLLPLPVRRGNLLVYALPGGGEFAA